MQLYRLFIYILTGITISTLCGCDAGNSAGVSSSTATTNVSGSVIAGPTSGSSVTVKSAAGIIVAGTVFTATDGSYTIAIPSSALTSDLVFEASGGSFPDEATSTTGVSLGTLSAHITAGSLTSGANVSIDPSSTIIQRLVAGGKSRTQAEADFLAAFGYKPDTTVKPAFATISSASSPPQRLLGFRAAVFSQLTKDLGLLPAQQSDLIKAIAEDLSDGKLDGKKGGTLLTASALAALGIPGISTYSEDISNLYAASFITFMASANNKCKLTAAQINAPPSGTVSLTSTYRVEYLPPAGGDIVSKNTFQLKITSRSTGLPVGGLAASIILQPDMVMKMVMGTVWPNAVVESSTPGTYSGTVYYSMATTGLSMYWKLSVRIGAETAVFYPNIAGFKTGNTISSKFSSGTDITTGTTKRSYQVWRDPLAGTDSTYDFTLFVSSTDGPITFPVYAGQSWTTAPLALSTITLLASTDGATWVAMTPVGTNSGRYTARGLNLMLGMSMPVYIKLSINGNIYTSNGAVYDNGTGITSNAVQTFSVAP